MAFNCMSLNEEEIQTVVAYRMENGKTTMTTLGRRM